MSSIDEFKELKDLYSADVMDLLTRLFPGGFINFGYWPEGTATPISVEEKIASSVSLYKRTFEALDACPSHRAMELGVGYGAGAQVFLEHYPVASFIGVDANPRHAAMSATRCSAFTNAYFIHASSDVLPVPDASIDRIYSLEAFQHFNVAASIQEIKRVLAPGGRLVVNTVFPTRAGLVDRVTELVPFVSVYPEIGNADDIVLPTFLSLLERSGFRSIRSESIGAHVWPLWHAWVAQVAPETWNFNWLEAYETGLIDYCIVTADVPVLIP